MKLPKNLFPPVELSLEQCAAYEKLSDDVVNQAMTEYDDFNIARRRQLDRKRWKQIKKSDGITVFCERSGRLSSSSSSASSAASDIASLSFSESDDDRRDTEAIRSPASKLSAAAVSSIAENEVVSTSEKERAALPKLLAVGRVPGKVEDMLFGMMSPTLTHSKIKTAYVNDEVADCRYLYEIRGPTLDEPLRFLGLKWTIKGHSPIIGTVVRQRDLVFVESVGLKTRADGSRIGYFVMHSVEVPECGELAQFSIVRARISLVYILRQDGPGQVDVFMKSYVEINGTLPDAVGVRTSANSMICVAAVEIGAHGRKMGWEVTKRLRNCDEAALLRPPSSSRSNAATCSSCNKSFSVFSSALVCFFCTSRVCSKCCEQRELTIPNAAVKRSSSAPLVLQKAINACKPCYSAFRTQSAEQVAREEVLAREYGSVPRVEPREHRSQSASSTPSSDRLNITGLQHLAVSRKTSFNRPMQSNQRQPSDIQQQQQREWSDSVIELDREDFARGYAGPYRGVTHPHMPAYQPAPGYHERSIAAFSNQPFMMQHHQPPMHYNTPQPTSYASPRMGRHGQPHMGYNAASQHGYYGQPPVSPQPPSEDLYARITKLQQTAEHVYQYTKYTTDKALGTGGDAAFLI